jgi:post-segregation antitoxin (ccd killing protein)
VRTMRKPRPPWAWEMVTVRLPGDLDRLATARGLDYSATLAEAVRAELRARGEEPPPEPPVVGSKSGV